MPQRGVDAPAFARRKLLTGGAALVAWGAATAAGCSASEPRADGPTRPRDRPQRPGQATRPSATPARTEFEGANRRELPLLEAATAVLTAANAPRPGSARSAMLTQIRQGHLAHRTALASASPTTRPVGADTPAAPPSSHRVAITASLATLQTAERGAATAYLSLARTSEGVLSLFWASLGCAAASYAVALQTGLSPAKASPPGERTRLVPPSEVEAMQSMVAQLHAVNYGYELLIGRLGGARRDRATQLLRSHRVLRDQLVELLIARSESVPPAAPAYDPPVQPSNAAKAAQLVRQMEVGLQPWAGRWVAAATRSADRSLAVEALLSSTRTAAAWGSALPAWPGWLD